MRLHRRGRSPSLPCGAEEDKGRVAAVDVHGDRTATGATDNDIGILPVELGLGDANGGVEIVVGEGWVQDLMSLLSEVGRLGPALKPHHQNCFREVQPNLAVANKHERLEL